MYENVLIILYAWEIIIIVILYSLLCLKIVFEVLCNSPSQADGFSQRMARQP